MVVLMRTVSDIIEAAGGVQAIARHLPSKVNRLGRPVDRASAVYKWTGTGIPERHWPLLIKLAKTSPSELFKANQAVRQSSTAGVAA